MTTGLQAQGYSRTFVVRILEAATATNGAPSSYAASGVDVGAILDERYGKAGWPESAIVAVYTTAGSATMTATIKLWGGHPDLGSAGVYLAAGTGPAATAGVLNGGAAYDEHATDNINRADWVISIGAFKKWYAEVVAIGGTSTAVTVDLILPAVAS